MSLSKEKNYLLYLLSKQDYSRFQLTSKLQQRANISNDDIEMLLDEFEANKWLSDRRFAEAFITSEVNKLRGIRRIKNSAIYQKGLGEELIDLLLNQLDIDWFELCKNCLNKKYKEISLLRNDFKLKQKAVSYLIYNGFDSEQINYALEGK